MVAASTPALSMNDLPLELSLTAPGTVRNYLPSVTDYLCWPDVAPLNLPISFHFVKSLEVSIGLTSDA